MCEAQELKVPLLAKPNHKNGNPNPFAVIEQIVTFGETCTLRINDKSIVIDCESRLADLVNRLGVQPDSIFDRDGRAAYANKLLYHIGGVRFCLGGRHFRYYFYKEFTTWRRFWQRMCSSHDGVSPHPVSVDCVNEIASFARRYKSMLKAEANWQMNRSLLLSCLLYTRLHRHDIERVLAVCPAPLDACSMCDFWAQVDDAVHCLQRPETFELTAETRSRLEAVLTQAVERMRYSESNWQLVGE